MAVLADSIKNSVTFNVTLFFYSQPLYFSSISFVCA